jgi:hypothetical protein
MSSERIGYRDSRGFIWPNSVLCREHLTQERVDHIHRQMSLMNTTAWPMELRESDAECCVVCKGGNRAHPLMRRHDRWTKFMAVHRRDLVQSARLVATPILPRG